MKLTILSNSEQAKMAVLAILAAHSELGAMKDFELPEAIAPSDRRSAEKRSRDAAEWLSLTGPPECSQ